jgi:hypothetical protein
MSYRPKPGGAGNAGVPGWLWYVRGESNPHTLTGTRT